MRKVNRWRLDRMRIRAIRLLQDDSQNLPGWSLVDYFWVTFFALVCATTAYLDALKWIGRVVREAFAR